MTRTEAPSKSEVDTSAFIFIEQFSSFGAQNCPPSLMPVHPAKDHKIDVIVWRRVFVKTHGGYRTLAHLRQPR